MAVQFFRRWVWLVAMGALVCPTPAVTAQTVEPTLGAETTGPLHESVKSSPWPTPAAGPSTSGAPELILTFDDGPNRTTPLVLDVLDKYHVQGIFFMVGRAIERGDPALVRATIDRMLASGNVVANHTMTHAQMCTVPRDVAAREIDLSRIAVESATGMSAEWFRTPYGSRCGRLESLLAERNLQHFHWDIDPQEWRNRDSKRVAALVLNKVRRLTGRAVLLMHDIHAVTARALPIILDGIATLNEERRLAGQPEIRIVPPWQLAEERMKPGLAALLHDLVTNTVDALASAGAVIP